MDLKISVYKSSVQLLENKECFKETVNDVPDDFGYSNLIKAIKSVFGDMSIIKFCMI